MQINKGLLYFGFDKRYKMIYTKTKGKRQFMVDTHAHLQDEKFEDQQAVIKGALEANVNKIICSSSDLNTSKQAVRLAQRYAEVYATVGVHPHDAKTYCSKVEDEIKLLAQNKKVVAIGEIGLDYHYMYSSKEEQINAFIKQIDLAYELNLPIVIHSREATGDTMEILRNNLHKLKNGVCIHCFNMSLEILKEIDKYGFYISVGGIVTFKNASNIIDIVKNCDINKLMLETDAPYLTPAPFRSKINEPKYVKITAEKIAEIKIMTVEEIDNITTKNAYKFFKIL